jgi:DNA polymerase III alpha subunit (gram-positive type)
MSRPTKRVFIDVETTGLYATKHAIHQIAGLIEIGGEVVDSFNINMRPFDDAWISDEALAVTKKTKAEIMAYPDWKTQFVKLRSCLEKHIDKSDPADRFVFLAYNAPFDNEFIRAMFKRSGDWKLLGKTFVNPQICIMVLAGMALEPKLGTLEKFKLGHVARELGLEVEEGNLHDALVDIELSRQVFYKVMGE